MPKLAPYVARKGGTFLFRRRPPVHSALAGRGLNTRPHVAVALRTRDPREAGRRASAINAIAEAGWLMEIPDEEVREILRALTAGINALPGALPASRRVEAERRLNEEALRAFEGKPSRLDDPDLVHSRAKRNASSKPDCHIPAKLRQERLDRGFVAEAFARSEVDGHGDLLDVVLADLVEVGPAGQPSSDAAVISDNHPVRRRQPCWPLSPAGGRA